MSALPSSPILVVSPALRAGTTLLQRLLCSAPNTLIQGDLVGQEMEFFAKYDTPKKQMMRLQEGQIAPVRNAALTWPGGGAAEAALGETTITLAPHREAS